MIARTAIAIAAIMVLEGCVVPALLTAGTSTAANTSADQGAKFGT